MTGLSVLSDAGADRTYGDGETISIGVTFDEAVTVTGTPQLTIDMDPADWGEKQAAYHHGSGSTTLVFTYAVEEPNISTQGIAVLANSLALNGGTIVSASGSAAAGLSHDGLGHDSDHMVDWQAEPEGGAIGTSGPGGTSGNDPTPTPPTVTGVSIASDPGADDTYGPGDMIRISVTFDEAVDVTGTPQLTIDMDPADWGEKQAAYHHGSGSTTLVFTYAVEEPNISTQGIAVLANSLALNGGTIVSASGSAAAGLSHDGLGHDSDHMVDWQAEPEGGAIGTSGPGGTSGNDPTPTPPTVTGVSIASDPGADDTYGPGDMIRISVTFDEAVDVTGTPQLTIDMDPADWGEKQASYAGGSGSTTLVFTHTVVEPNISTQGIAVLANSLALNGGDIESASTDTDADLSHTGLSHDANHKVDWQQ